MRLPARSRFRAASTRTVKWERSVSGDTLMGPKRKGGSPGVWDSESGNIAKNWADLMTDKITVQQYLDLAQKNYEQSYM